MSGTSCPDIVFKQVDTLADSTSQSVCIRLPSSHTSVIASNTATEAAPTTLKIFSITPDSANQTLVVSGQVGYQPVRTTVHVPWDGQDSIGPMVSDVGDAYQFIKLLVRHTEGGTRRSAEESWIRLF